MYVKMNISPTDGYRSHIDPSSFAIGAASTYRHFPCSIKTTQAVVGPISIRRLPRWLDSGPTSTRVVLLSERRARTDIIRALTVSENLSQISDISIKLVSLVVINQRSDWQKCISTDLAPNHFLKHLALL